MSLGELTPGTYSELSNLSETNSVQPSPRIGPISKEEVKNLVIPMVPTTRSQARAQSVQAQSLAQTSASASQQTANVSAPPALSSRANSAPAPLSPVTPPPVQNNPNPVSTTPVQAPPIINIQPQQQQLPILPPTNPRMALANLPSRSEHSAPSFDNSWLEELARYFTNLRDLFRLHMVNANDEHKQGALKYLKV